MTHSCENTVQVEQVRVPGLEELLETWSGTDSRFLLESGIEVGGTGRWNFWGGSPIDEWTDHGRQRQRSPASSRGNESSQPQAALGLSRRYRYTRRPLLAREHPQSSR